MAELSRLTHIYKIHQTKANQAFEVYAAYKFALLKRVNENSKALIDQIHAVDKEYKHTDEYLNIFKEPQV